ncbi:MAG: hypothetical protein AAGJ46_11250 [Planctomycetota bacterium]
MIRSSHLFALFFLAPVGATAQDAAAPSGGEAAQPAAAPPVIADEPMSIDPATLMPTPLAAPATVRFQGESLLEVAQWLTSQPGLTGVIDRAALDDFGVALGEPVYIELDDEPIYLLLDRLRVLGLAWFIEDGVVTITTQEEAETRLTTETYNLGDLLDAGYDRELIIDGVISTIAAETWAENGGGDAEIQWLGDVLFVSQTQPVQRQIAGLLKAIRKHGRRTFVYEPSAHAQIRTKLDQPITIRMRQTPLVVAVEKIGEAAGVAIGVNQSALDDFAIGQREPISVDLKRQSLRTVLRVALGGLELTAIPRDGMLTVTTEEEAETALKAAVYDVRDLCRDNDEGNALIDAIVRQVASSTWAENGGGESELRFFKPGVLVASQTEANHRELLSLLEQYRQALTKSKPRTEPGPDPAEVLTRYYRLPQAMATDLRVQLPTLVAPRAWRSDKKPGAVGVIHALNSTDLVQVLKPNQPPRVAPHVTLIIRQTRAAHQEIERLIERVKSGDGPINPPEGKQFGGGGGLGGGGFGGGYFSVEPPRSPRP